MSITALLHPVAPDQSEKDSTAALPLADLDELVDALPLLHHQLSRRTIVPEHALRGQYLALRDGEETRLLALRHDVTYLGRGPGCDVRLDDHRVSRSHAVLVRHGRHFRLLDNRSLNGTYVNGRRAQAVNLSSGDEIALGPLMLEFVDVP